jgi:hypothetical protein
VACHAVLRCDRHSALSALCRLISVSQAVGLLVRAQSNRLTMRLLATAVGQPACNAPRIMKASRQQCTAHGMQLEGGVARRRLLLGAIAAGACSSFIRFIYSRRRTLSWSRSTNLLL